MSVCDASELKPEDSYIEPFSYQKLNIEKKNPKKFEILGVGKKKLFKRFSVKDSKIL